MHYVIDKISALLAKNYELILYLCKQYGKG